MRNFKELNSNVITIHYLKLNFLHSRSPYYVVLHMYDFSVKVSKSKRKNV